MLNTIYIQVSRCAPNMKATLRVHIMHFSPIENHYKEKFNVSGLLNKNSHMKNNY